MNNYCKAASIALLVLLIAASLIMVKPAAGQSKPSVPEFTISVTDQSYDVPTTTTSTTDLDGRVITKTTPGYHMMTGKIEVSIKNQPFTPYYDSDGYPIKLYYHIRVKLLNPVYWRYFPGEESYFEATNATYTTVTYGYLGHDFVHDWAGMPAYSPYRVDGTVDFQVEAFIGHTNTTYRYTGAPVIRSEDLIVKYVGQTSGWSNTQTATIPNGAYTPSIPTPLPTAKPTSTSYPTTSYIPTIPSAINGNGSTEVIIQISFTNLVLTVGIAVAIILVVVIGVLIYMRQRRVNYS
jgi:hypothetical protein